MSVAKSIFLLILVNCTLLATAQIEPPQDHQWKTVDEFLQEKGINTNSSVAQIKNTFFDVTSNRERIDKIRTYPTLYAICFGSRENGLSSLVNCCNFAKLSQEIRNKFTLLCSQVSDKVMDGELNEQSARRKLAYWLAKEQHHYYAANYDSKLEKGSNEYIFYSNFTKNKNGNTTNSVAAKPAENNTKPSNPDKSIKSPKVVSRSNKENDLIIEELNERVESLENQVSTIDPSTLSKAKSSWLEWLGYAMLTLICWFIIGTILHVLGRKNFLSQSSLKMKEAVRSLFSSGSYKGNQERLEFVVQQEIKNQLRNYPQKSMPAASTIGNKEVKVMPEIEEIIQSVIHKQKLPSGEMVSGLEKRMSSLDSMVQTIFQEMNDEELLKEMVKKEIDTRVPTTPTEEGTPSTTIVTEEIDPKKLSAQVQWQVTEFLTKNPETLARLLPTPEVAQRIVTEEVDPKKLSAQVQWHLTELLKNNPEIIAAQIPASKDDEAVDQEQFKAELAQFFTDKIEAHFKWLDEQFVALKEDLKVKEVEYSENVSKKYETDFDERLFRQTEIIANLQDDLRSYLPNTEVKQLIVQEIDTYKQEIESKNRHLREAETMIQRLGEKIREIEYRNEELQKKVYRLERGK